MYRNDFAFYGTNRDSQEDPQLMRSGEFFLLEEKGGKIFWKKYFFLK